MSEVLEYIHAVEGDPLDGSVTRCGIVVGRGIAAFGSPAWSRHWE
jgi:hypothetical protein